MKAALYVATVAGPTGKAIDDCLRSEELWRQNLPWYQGADPQLHLPRIHHGIFFGRPDEEAQIYDSNYIPQGLHLPGAGGARPTRQMTSVLRAASAPSSATKFSVGGTIEVMKPDGSSPSAKVLAIYDEEGNPMESAPHPKQKLYVKLDVAAEPLDVLRRKD